MSPRSLPVVVADAASLPAFSADFLISSAFFSSAASLLSAGLASGAAALVWLFATASIWVRNSVTVLFRSSTSLGSTTRRGGGAAPPSLALGACADARPGSRAALRRKNATRNDRRGLIRLPRNESGGRESSGRRCE